jgi:uncharacterized cupin superfamily protein
MSSQLRQTAWKQTIAEADDWAPFTHPTPDGGEATFGEISWIRQGGSGDGTLLVCLWRQATPATSPPYDFFAGDETGHLLEGRVTVELVESGERIELAAGDVYSFSKGTLSRWIVHEPVTKVAVIAHSDPLAP